MKSTLRLFLMFILTLTASMMGAQASLPSGWSDMDIPSSGTLAGSASGTIVGGIGTFTVAGAKGNVSSTTDAFHYAWQSVTGNFTFIARLTGQSGTNLQDASEAGIMVRESTAAGSREVMLNETFKVAGGMGGEEREFPSGISTPTGGGGADTVYPCWLKMVRYNNNFTLYWSNDSTAQPGTPAGWTTTDGETLQNLPSTVLIGLGVENGLTGKGLNTATFDNVSISPIVQNISSNGQPVSTSWLGNTFSGYGLGQGYNVVQTTGYALGSDSSGNCYLSGFYANDGATTFFDTSGNFNGFGSYEGSNSIVYDSINNYVWIAQAFSANNYGGIEYYPPGGVGGNASYVGYVLTDETSSGQRIVGMAISGSNLYAVDQVDANNSSDSTGVTVHVIDLSTKQVKSPNADFLVPVGAMNLAADSSGNLWIVFNYVNPTIVSIDTTAGSTKCAIDDASTIAKGEAISGNQNIPGGATVDHISGAYLYLDVSHAATGTAAGIDTWFDTGIQGNVCVKQYSNTGTPTGAVLNFRPELIAGTSASPQGIAIDSSNNVYVADNSSNQDIEVFDSSGNWVRSFGAQGGIYSTANGTNPGQTDASKLDHPWGLTINGTNLWVTANGPGASMSSPSFKSPADSGMVLRKYTSITTASSSTLAWERDGLEATGVGGTDTTSADDGVDVYTNTHHYKIDWSKPPGQGWTYVGETQNDFSYPNDSRNEKRSHTNPEPIAAHVQTMAKLPSPYNANKFMVAIGSGGGNVSFYRFQSNSEILVPYGIVTPSDGTYNGHTLIWTDTNHSGVIDSGDEFDTAGFGSTGNGLQSPPYVDVNGDIWAAMTLGGSGKHTQSVVAMRVTANGNGDPTWSSSTGKYTSYTIPAAFSGGTNNGYEAQALAYVPSSDTMYLSGFTQAIPNTGSGDLGCGTQLLCYTGWEAHVNSQAAPAFTIDLPLKYWTSGKGANATKCWGVAGSVIASCSYNQPPQVSLFNATTSTMGTPPNQILPGGLITQFSAGPEVGGIAGPMDNNTNFEIYQRTNGEYLIFAADDGEQRNVIYRWNPWMDLEIGTGTWGSGYNAATDTWTITDSNGGGIAGGTTDGFHFVYRGMTGNGTVIANLSNLNCSTSTAKAGIMIRNDLTTSAAFAASLARPSAGNQEGYYRRKLTGGSTTSVTTTGVPPTWFEVTRSGSSCSVYEGTDGIHWGTAIDTQTITAMTNAEVYVGLPVSSNNTGTTATATISNVTITP